MNNSSWLKSFDLENRVRDIAQLNARIKELANGGMLNG
jgi:hypothetical protein